MGLRWEDDYQSGGRPTDYPERPVSCVLRCCPVQERTTTRASTTREEWAPKRKADMWYGKRHKILRFAKKSNSFMDWKFVMVMVMGVQVYCRITICLGPEQRKRLMGSIQLPPTAGRSPVWCVCVHRWWSVVVTTVKSPDPEQGEITPGYLKQPTERIYSVHNFVRFFNIFRICRHPNEFFMMVKNNFQIRWRLPLLLWFYVRSHKFCSLKIFLTKFLLQSS